LSHYHTPGSNRAEVCGGALHPQNPAYNPTITIGALTFWQADGITKSFNFDNPASLA
jgi:hypothetical protein